MTKLVVALQAESAAERWQAIEYLDRVDDKSALTEETLLLLVDALTDDHPFVRWQAGLVLANQADGAQKLSDLLSSSSVNVSDEARKAHLAAIDALGKSQLANAHLPLLQALNASDALLRQSAAEALANLKAPDAVPALITALQDSDPWVRRAAAYALGHIGAAEATRELVNRLRDESVIVRRSAAYALGALRAKSAFSQLKVSLTDQDKITRRNAVWAIGRLDSPEAMAELNIILEDPNSDAEIKATASQAIEIIKKPRWLQRLLGLGERFHR